MTSTDLEPITPNALAPVTPADTDSWAEVVGQVAKLAAHIADTDFVPKGLRGSSAAVTAAILYGREVGLPPMTALTQVHVVEGRPALSAEGMRALILAAGHDLEIRTATGAIATVAGRRRGSGRWSEVTWNIDMARAAGVIKPKSAWEHYPRAMLVARATVELARQLFPDVIHGFRAVEEIDDTPAPETEPLALDSTPGPTVRRAPRAARKAATPEPAPTPTPTSGGAVGMPPLPGEPGFTETPTIGEVVSPTPAPVVGPETSTAVEGEASTAVEPTSAGGVTSQDPPPAEPDPEPPALIGEIEVIDPDPEPRARGVDIQAVRLTFEKKLGVTDRDQRLAYVSAIVGREIDTTTQLTRREAKTILGTLDFCATVDDLDLAVNAALEHRAAVETPQ